MPAMILRLLTLAALLLMPFGMGAASAVAAQHATTTAAAAGHCDEPAGQPAEQAPDQASDCAMACSMMATAEAGVDDLDPYLHSPAARPLAERGAGLHPDTATPPPKLS